MDLLGKACWKDMDVRQEGKRKTTDKLKEEEDSQNLVNNPAKIIFAEVKIQLTFYTF